MKSNVKTLFMPILLLLMTASCTAGAVKQRVLPYFEPADCMFAVPGETSRCGWVYVPEDRSNPDSPKIKLAVKIFKSTSVKPKPDPIIFLQGGPGNPSLMMAAAGGFDKMVAPYLGERDYILLDQRGNGFSTPGINCTETSAWLDRSETFYTEDDFKATAIESMARCRERLMAQGIRIESYNSNENAADVDAVRQALGIEEWNLVGVSYGSRLALTVMRNHPEHVRSVVIGSISPPMTKYHWGVADAERLFRSLFDRCEADLGCNEAYPDLEAVFFNAIEKYNADPIRVVIKDPLPGSKLDGQTIHWNFTGGQISGILYGEMYSAALLGKAPQLIYSLAEGDKETIKKLVIRNILIAPAYISFGHLLAIDCMDSYAFETRQSMKAAYDFHPRSGGLQWGRSMTYGKFVVDLCEAFVDTSQADRSYPNAVFSDIPTLIMNGDLDSATPPDYAIMTAATLKNSQLFILNGVGHSPLVEGACPISMVKQFLDNPDGKVDAGCMEGAFPGVKFELPGDPELAAPKH